MAICFVAHGAQLLLSAEALPNGGALVPLAPLRMVSLGGFRCFWVGLALCLLICIVVFRTPMSLAGAVGSAVAIGGSYFYAMVKTSEKEASEKADRAEATAAAIDVDAVERQ